MRQLKIAHQITLRDSSALDKYFTEIARYELISIDKEAELSQRVKQGDCEAVNAFVRANLRFVVSVAKQYQNQGLSLADLISEGNVGLIKAANKFDDTRGFKFITYAVWWIRQCIIESIQENSRMVRLPLNQHHLLNKYNRVVSEFENKNNRKPRIDEVSDMIDVPIENLNLTIRASQKHASLDIPFTADDELSLIDVTPDENAIIPDTNCLQESDRVKLSSELSSLNEREHYILIHDFGIGTRAKTLEEIGEALGITKERTRQIKRKALAKLSKKQELKQMLN